MPVDVHDTTWYDCDVLDDIKSDVLVLAVEDKLDVASMLVDSTDVLSEYDEEFVPVESLVLVSV